MFPAFLIKLCALKASLMVVLIFNNARTKVINVPQADLTLITGTLYQLDTNWFRMQLKALEVTDYGIVHERTHKHNTEVTVAGVTYARTLEIINGYSITFESGSYSVRLVGSNNNFFDIENGILNQNQVQVIPTNSAGLVNIAQIEDVRKVTINKVTKTGTVITIYEDDGVSVWKQFDLAGDQRIEQ